MVQVVTSTRKGRRTRLPLLFLLGGIAMYFSATVSWRNTIDISSPNADKVKIEALLNERESRWKLYQELELKVKELQAANAKHAQDFTSTNTTGAPDTEDGAWEVEQIPIMKSKSRGGRSTSTEKDDRRVNGSANDIPVAATIVPKIKVDFYGGSISLSSGLHNSRNRFTDIIGEELKQVELQNKAIGGAGVQHWLHCGIQPVDVIVSEFRINEGNTRVLEEWYMMTSKFAQHTVVLDLWSWLTPPHIISATELALHNLKKKFPHVNQTFSILSLSNRDKDVWREKVRGFFNYTATDRPISEKCYANVLESDQEDAGLKRWCTRAHANEMQHGRESYHRDVASSLAKHMKDHVLPFISLGETPSLGTERLCIGSWGMMEAAWRDVDQFKENLIVGETTFQFSSPLSKRKDKLTLNTNSTSSTVRLDCPAPYNSMILGHIVHSDLEESAIFEVNGKNISTHDHLEERPHIRIRKYTEQSFKTPLDISISSLHPGAYLELTDVVCKKENVTGSD